MDNFIFLGAEALIGVGGGGGGIVATNHFFVALGFPAHKKFTGYPREKQKTSIGFDVSSVRY